MEKQTDDEKWQRILGLGKEIRGLTSEMLSLLNSSDFDDKLKAQEIVQRLQELEKEQEALMDEALQ